MQCKWTVSKYKDFGLEWIRLPIFERAMHRYNGHVIQINSVFKKWVFGELTPGSAFFGILDEVESKDREVLSEIMENITNNEIYPSLSHIEKIDQWASNAIENMEDRIEDRFFLDVHRFDWFYEMAVEDARLFLREWVQKTPDQRDEERLRIKLQGENIRQPLKSLYEEDETLRALWQFITAGDMLSKSQRDIERQKAARVEMEERWSEHFAQERERLEWERQEAETLRQENEEKVSQWESLSFEEREALRNNREDITYQVRIRTLPVELKERIETIEENDRQTREQLVRREREEREAERVRVRQRHREAVKKAEETTGIIQSQDIQHLIEPQQLVEPDEEAQRLAEVQQQIDNWRELSFEQRESQRRSSQGLTDQIDPQTLPNNLREQIETIENSDSLTREQVARRELNRRKDMSYEARAELEQPLEELVDILLLSEALQNEIRQLRENDREIRANRRKTSQWAAVRSRQERLEFARDTIQDQSIVGYRETRIKMWPIRCYNRNINHIAYPYTDDTKPIHVNLSSSDGLRLEIHSNASRADEFMLIDGEIDHMRLQIKRRL